MTDTLPRLPYPAQEQLRNWWRRISREDASGPARAARAQLRRAHDLTAVTCLPAYQLVYRSMADSTDESRHWAPYRDRLAAAVALAAHVKVGGTLSLPLAMSKRISKSDDNPVSDLRFRRLLESPDIESLFVGIRRLIPLARELDPVSLAADLFEWGDGVRRRWAYDYQWPDV